MSCNLAFKWRWRDDQATAFASIVEGATFSIHLDPGGAQDQVVYCTADTFLTSTPDTFYCRVFSNPERTAEITSGDFTGLSYVIDYLDGWTWSSADLYGNVDPQRVGSWRSAQLTLCAEGGVWDGQWVAIAQEGGTLQFVFDGSFTRYPLSVTGVSASPTSGSLAAGTYVYNVSAIDSTGKEGAASLPASVTLSASGGVDLLWSATTGAVEYHIYRNGEFLTKVTAPTTSFTDDGTLSTAPFPVPRETPEAGIEDPIQQFSDGGVTIDVLPGNWTYSTNPSTKATQGKVTGTDQGGLAYTYEVTETPNVQVDVKNVPSGWDGITPIMKVTEQTVTYDSQTQEWTVVTSEPDGSESTITVDPDEVCTVTPGVSETPIQDLFDPGTSDWTTILNLDGLSNGFPTINGLTPTALGTQLTYPVDVTLALINNTDNSDTPTEVVFNPGGTPIGDQALSNPSNPGPNTFNLTAQPVDLRVFQNFGLYAVTVQILFQTGVGAGGELCVPKQPEFNDPVQTGICRITETIGQGTYDPATGTWSALQVVEVECLEGATSLPVLTDLYKVVKAGTNRSNITTTPPGSGPPAPKTVYPDTYLGPSDPNRGSTPPSGRPTTTRGQPAENTYLNDSVAGTPAVLWSPTNTEQGADGTLRLPASLADGNFDPNYAQS